MYIIRPAGDCPCHSCSGFFSLIFIHPCVLYISFYSLNLYLTTVLRYTHSYRTLLSHLHFPPI